MKHCNAMTTLRIFPLLGFGFLLSGCDAPPMKAYTLPSLSTWAPEMAPTVASNTDAFASPAAFRTLHGNSYNADEVWLAYAPVFEQGWIAETHLFVPEGPTFDEQGNIYFSPLLPPEDVLLVSLDPTTGARRWAITGKREGSGGAPLIMKDAQDPQKQVIYSGSYERIMAVSPEGQLLWDKPTGLTANGDSSALLSTHNYGVNYLPQHNALISITGDGHIIALDRTTGELLAPTTQIPGAPAEVSSSLSLPSWAITRADQLLAPLFDPMIADSGSLFGTLAKALLGDGAVVSNYFAVDPNSGTIWIASTAPDTADGVNDGIAAYGALYAYALTPSGTGSFTLAEQCHAYFPGGSASSPTLSADGQRVYIGDSYSAVLALDTQCQTVWSQDVGSQVVGSLAVSQDNHEIYAATGLSIIKLVDEGAQGRQVWKATMDMFTTKPGQTSGNLNLAGVGANGVMIHVGGGYAVKGQLLPLSMGVALLDRDTGKVRYATQGLEETVSVMSSNEDGALYLGHSPFRHALALALTGKKTPLLGGIGQYRAKNTELLIRDASCAAAARLQNQRQAPHDDAQKTANLQQVAMLARQAEQAIATATLDATERSQLIQLLSEAIVQLGAQTPADNWNSTFTLLQSACTLSQ